MAVAVAARKERETKMACKVRIFNHLGRQLGAHEASSINEAQSWADTYHPHGEAVVRVPETGDGSVWPDFGGAVASVREGGRWARV